MSRVRFLDSPENFFLQVQERTGFSFEQLGKVCHAHRRSFSDWRRGRLLMPLRVFEKIVEITGLKEPAHAIVPDYWHIRDAARKGAARRMELYGPPGTPEGRRKGGLISSRKFMENPLLARGKGFVVRREINEPKNLEKFSECVGIILGDGTVAKMQVVVTVHRTDDIEFAHYIRKLFAEVFGFTPSLIDRKREGVVAVIASSRNLVELLIKRGMKVGNKVRQQVGIPPFILKTKKLRGMCLRGLFDTDGCFYVDKHKIRGKMYLNCAMNFTNHSIPILNFFKNELIKRGYHPTQRTPWGVFLRREEEIAHYFFEIGSSNPKHTRKFISYFIQKHGRVPKWS